MTNRVARGFVRRLTLLCAVASCAACHFERARGTEELESATLPEDVRDDYTLFAQRCSKCHSLARPLQSGITDEEYWRNYVERMRRQPGSGIAPDEAPRILRFLSYYSGQKRAGTASPASARRSESADTAVTGTDHDAFPRAGASSPAYAEPDSGAPPTTTSPADGGGPD